MNEARLESRCTYLPLTLKVTVTPKSCNLLYDEKWCIYCQEAKSLQVLQSLMSKMVKIVKI